MTCLKAGPMGSRTPTTSEVVGGRDTGLGPEREDSGPGQGGSAGSAGGHTVTAAPIKRLREWGMSLGTA